MLMQYTTLLAASTLFANTAIADRFVKPGVLFSRQLVPANCPVDYPGTQTCDAPGHCYDPTQYLCCGYGSGVTCPIGDYCNPSGCCKIGELCTGTGGTLIESTVKTIVNPVTIPLIVSSTSTSAISYTSSVVPSSSSSTTSLPSPSGTDTSSTYVPPSAPASSSSAPTTIPTVPIPVPAPSSATVTPSPSATLNTTSVAPAQFSGGAVSKTGDMAGGRIAAVVGLMGLVGLL